MVDVVMIIGIKDGSSKYISKEMFFQMVGRGGREYGSKGYVDIFCRKDDKEYIRCLLADDSDSNNGGQYDDVEELYTFHLLPMIMNGFVNDRKDVQKWLSCTYYGERLIDSDKLIKYGMELNVIDKINDKLVVTDLGKLSIYYYFLPSIVRAWMHNWRVIINNQLISNDAAVCWAMSDIPFLNYIDEYCEIDDSVLYEYKSELPDMCVYTNSNYRNGIVFYGALGNLSDLPIGVKHKIKELRGDIPRMLSCIGGIFDLIGVRGQYGNDLQFLEKRFLRGIDKKIARVCKIYNVSKSRARMMIDDGCGHE